MVCFAKSEILLIHIEKLPTEPLLVSHSIEEPTSIPSVVTKAGGDGSLIKPPFETTEEEEEVTAAREIRVGATAWAVSSELDTIFLLKDEQRCGWKKMFSIYWLW